MLSELLREQRDFFPSTSGTLVLLQRARFVTELPWESQAMIGAAISTKQRRKDEAGDNSHMQWLYLLGFLLSPENRQATKGFLAVVPSGEVT